MNLNERAAPEVGTYINALHWRKGEVTDFGQRVSLVRSYVFLYLFR